LHAMIARQLLKHHEVVFRPCQQVMSALTVPS